MMVFAMGFKSNLSQFISTTLELVNNIVVWLHYDKEY